MAEYGFCNYDCFAKAMCRRRFGSVCSDLPRGKGLFTSDRLVENRLYILLIMCCVAMFTGRRCIKCLSVKTLMSLGEN